MSSALNTQPMHSSKNSGAISGAKLLVQCLEKQGVTRIFGIPGAKIDTVFNELLDSQIELILCRHEQNAAFMAAAHGRLTGEPGVVLVTSGPGVSNLATGLLTATTEGDPIVAIGGNVARSMKLKESHQSTNNIKLLEAATKFCVEVPQAKNIPEIIDNAFRIAKKSRRGATFISFPQDIGHELTDTPAHEPLRKLQFGHAPLDLIQEVANKISQAHLPILLLGQEASRPENTQAIRTLLHKTKLPVIGTYQAAGAISHDLLECFVGRVGLFKNQPGDLLIDQADLIISIGFNPTEYDPELWNPLAQKKIIAIDYQMADIRTCYAPSIELLGNIENTLKHLSDFLFSSPLKQISLIQKLQSDHDNFHLSHSPNTIHPLEFIRHLRTSISDQTQYQTIVTCDIGSHYMWMARYFYTFEPHHLLFSNGQQTLGVALPWAISASLCQPHKKIISISGDGGFLFSSMELETAVRYQRPLIHFVWVDGTYNMVKEQQLMKYHRESGVALGKIDLVNYAKSFGAMGEKLTHAKQIPELLKKYENHLGPVLVEVPINYQDNPVLFQSLHTEQGG